MKITKLIATNYRNLDSINIDLNEYCNFIVGENNLGKSNLLDLFQIIFSNRSFSHTDFKDVSAEILIEITVKLDDIETGDLVNLEDEKENFQEVKKVLFKFKVKVGCYIAPPI